MEIEHPERLKHHLDDMKARVKLLRMQASDMNIQAGTIEAEYIRLETLIDQVLNH